MRKVLKAVLIVFCLVFIIFRLVELKRLSDFCSDHFPIFIKLSYEPEERHKQALPTPNLKKKKEAEKEIEKAK